MEARVESFYGAVPEILEAWVRRCRSEHTRRSYREGVMAFVRFLGLAWPAEASALLTVPVAAVQAFRDELAAKDAAPKTLNQRVSALSSFYRYLALCAAELRLPIVVPNPAHAQFMPALLPTRGRRRWPCRRRAPASSSICRPGIPSRADARAVL